MAFCVCFDLSWRRFNSTDPGSRFLGLRVRTTSRFLFSRSCKSPARQVSLCFASRVFHCGESWLAPGESGENPRSIGYLVSLGAFQLLDLGDATVGLQLALACPLNKLDNVDIYQVPHHGNGVAPQLTWALEPTVAVINNGPHKGGGAEGFQVVADSPRLEDIWQSHRPLDTALPYRTTDALTANLTDEEDCRGYWIKATVNSDGRSYSITNGRSGASRAYLSR